MADRKRFQNQALNSEDYEKVEEGAKALKNGGKLFTAVVIVFGVCKKYGPEFLKNLDRLRKFG